MDSKTKLALYKVNKLKISEDGEFNHKGTIHLKNYVLPIDEAWKNIMLDVDSYKFDKSNILELDKNFEGKPIQIKLHQFWYHLNSSQILALNYFYDFLGNLNRLNLFLSFLGIEEKAVESTLEFPLEDKSEIDFAIKLENGKHVYVEVKYSEKEFGPASSKKTDYLKRQKTLYSKLEMSFEDFKKHYQFARNIILGVNGNYSVFLVPQFNEKIIENFEKCSRSILNATSFNYKLKFWEDLLNVIPNPRVQEKYFDGVSNL